MAKKQTKKKSTGSRLRATFGRTGKAAKEASVPALSEADEEDEIEPEEDEEQDEDFDDEEEGEEEDDTDDEDEASVEPEEGLGFDIFENFARPRVNAGQSVYFLLFRNGETLGRRDWPYSLEMLRKEIKYGVVQVVCKDIQTHRILKKQMVTLSLDTPTAPVAQAEAQVAAPAPAQASSQLGLTDILALLDKSQERGRQDAKDQATSGQQSMATLMTMMLQMQQTQQQTQQQMLMQMQQSTATMIEKSNQTTAKMFELMQEQMKSIVTNIDKKAGVNDPLTLLKLMQDSEQRGIERMKEMMELQDDRESARSEIQLEIEKLKMELQKDKPQESGLDKLIGALTPVLAIASQMQGGGGAALPQPGAAPALPNVAPARQAMAASPQITGALPQKRPEEAPRKKAKQPEVVREVKDVTNQPQEGAVIPMKKADEKKDSETAREIENALVPHLGEWLMKRVPVAQAAQATLTILADRGISKAEVLEHFSKEKILQIRKSYGLPALADQWLTPYWETLEPLLKGGAA